MSRKDYEELSDIQLPPEQAEMLDIICDAWEECQKSDCTACADRPHKYMRIMACTAIKYTRLLYEADYRKQSEDITDKNFKSNNSEVMSNKEIEELATEIYTLFRSDTMSRALAHRLYDKSWRKQSEGEWMARGNGKIESANFPIVECSECHIAFCDLINNHYFMYRYCPYCGAKMKGGAE